jgi:hypothetical protein
LRVADSLSEHLAKLSFGFRRLTREASFLPICHTHHMGMREGELNPELCLSQVHPNQVQASQAAMAQQDGAQVVDNQVVGNIGAVNKVPDKILVLQFCRVPDGHKSRISLHKFRSSRPNG